MRSVCEENIMEHSHQVAIIAHALAVVSNKNFGGNVDIQKTVLLALYHETGEVITGDLPTPIKYFNPEIRDAYKGLEKKSCEKILDMLPENMREEYRGYVLPDATEKEYKLVKYADRLAAYLKCVEEVKAGNSEFKKAKSTIEKELKTADSPEVEYFMREFAPAYTLTLDELD